MSVSTGANKGARALSGALLAGMFLDYSGGIGIKYLVIIMAFGWVILHKSSIRILLRRRVDIIVFLGVPLLLALLHLGLWIIYPSGNNNISVYLVRFYNTVSSSLLILLLPLFARAGSQVVLRQMSIGVRAIGIALLVFFTLHVTGIINLGDRGDFIERYQIGYIGLDPRIPDVEETQQGLLAPRIAFTIPLMFGYELAKSTMSPILLFLSLLVVGSRGLIVGAVVLVLLWTLVRRLRGGGRRGLRIGVFMTVVVVIIGISGPMQFRVRGVFLERLATLMRGEDPSSLARLGHLIGYWNMIEAAPLKLLFGDGPAGYIDNPMYDILFGDSRVTVTEMSLLNIAIYYGLPYAILYSAWLYRMAWRLFTLRRAANFQKYDLGLVLGSMVFWITGNTNPQMTGPFAIIAYMLLWVRISELEARPVQRYVEGTRMPGDVHGSR